VKPMVNQIEIHPYCQQRDLVKFCKDHNIIVEAYAPLGSGALKLAQDDVIVDIARKVGKTPGQVLLRWSTQQGIVVLPKSSKLERMIENQDLFDFELTSQQMAAISALQPEQDKRTCPDINTIV